jgi:hypothetical protein
MLMHRLPDTLSDKQYKPVPAAVDSPVKFLGGSNQKLTLKQWKVQKKLKNLKQMHES